MSNTVEGILINKFPYQDKNLIGHVLLRNGMKLSVIFYGGQGGGRKSVGSVLQIGYLFKIVLTNTKKKSFEILSAKEYQPKWFHDKVASDPKAFYLLCFFCELVDKFSPVASEQSDLELDYDAHNGLFRLLSNGIFQLEKMGKNSQIDHNLALFTFLTKAMVELGVFPRTESCSISGSKITETSNVSLVAENGGFAFSSVIDAESQRKRSGVDGALLRKGIVEIAGSKYGEIENYQGLSSSICKELLEYICFQQNVHIKDFKTSSMIL